MAKKATKAQQALYDTVSALVQRNRETFMPMFKSIISSMTDEEAAAEKVAFDCGLVKVRSEAYEQISTIKDGKEFIRSMELSVMFEFLNSPNARRYWAKHKDTHDALNDLLWRGLIESGAAEEVKKNPAYYLAAQSEITNALSVISRTGGFQLSLDSRDAVAETGRGRSKIRYHFKDATEYGVLKPQDIKLLDYLLIEFHRTKQQESYVSLEAFAEWSGRKYSKANRQELREEIGESLKRLKGISADYIGQSRRRTRSYGSVSLCGGTAFVDHGGLIRWNWNTTFIDELTKWIPLDYAAETAKLPNTGNSFYISRFFDMHYRRNEGKPNELTVSVSKLVELSRNLPTIEEVRATRHSARSMIINPFFNDLDKIGRFVFTFTDENGTVMEREEIPSYDVFIKGKITAAYEDETMKPVHPERVKARKQHARKAAKKNATKQGEQPKKQG